MAFNQAQEIPFRPQQCPKCQNYHSDSNRCEGFTVATPPFGEILAVFSGENWGRCKRFKPIPDSDGLQQIAAEIRNSDIHYMKLIEMGVADNIPERSAIYYLAALERNPGNLDAAKNLSYLETKGLDITGIKGKYGFGVVEFPLPERLAKPPEEREQPPPLSSEDASAAKLAYDKAFGAIYSGFDVERRYYMEALEHNPNMREAWHEFRNAAREAGRMDIVEECDSAERILEGGGFIRNYRDILKSGDYAGQSSELTESRLIPVTSETPAMMLVEIPDKASGLAIWSLVLAIASFLLWFTTAIPAFIMGIVELVKIKRGISSRRGRGYALASTIISGIFVALFIVFVTAGLLGVFD